MQKSLKICFGLCLIISIVCFLQINYAQEDKQVKRVVKKITGEVAFVDKDFISIVYKRDDDHGKEYEMMLYIDKDVILNNIKENDLKNLNEQDVIRIEYVEIDSQVGSKRVAKRIRYLRKKKSPLILKGFRE